MVHAGMEDAVPRSSVSAGSAHCQIKCTLMSLFVQGGLKDRAAVTSLSAAHLFSAFIDPSVGLCVHVFMCV